MFGAVQEQNEKTVAVPKNLVQSGCWRDSRGTWMGKRAQWKHIQNDRGLHPNPQAQSFVCILTRKTSLKTLEQEPCGCAWCTFQG